MTGSRDVLACRQDVALAYFGVITGRDPIDGTPFHIGDALIYLADGTPKLSCLEGPAMTSPALALDPAAALTLVTEFWDHQPCSVNGSHGHSCEHGAAGLREFLAFAADRELTFSASAAALSDGAAAVAEPTTTGL